MKAYFVLSGLPLRNEAAISLVSAFAEIETVGAGEDMLDALGIIRHWHPSAPLFYAISDDAGDLMRVVMDGKTPVAILTAGEDQGPCTYFCADFSGGDEEEGRWLVSSLFSSLRGYVRQGVR